jgi:hypothetical protein
MKWEVQTITRIYTYLYYSPDTAEDKAVPIPKVQAMNMQRRSWNEAPCEYECFLGCCAV